MKGKLTAMLAGCLLLGTAAVSWAHSPICTCYDNGDGTVTCEGGFSDGGSATGVAIYVKGPDGAQLQKGSVDAMGEYTFKKPGQDYVVVFDAGEGHSLTIDGKDIVE